MLPFLLAILTFVALVPVLLPPIRGRASFREEVAFDRAVYKDQLREVDLDIECGMLTDVEASSTRLEIQRRLIAVRLDITPPRFRKGWTLAGITGLSTIGGAIGLYSFLGMPIGPPILSVGSDTAALLADRVNAHPDDANGWTLYAHALGHLERWADAETAWRQVIALSHSSFEAFSSLGEILVLRNNDTITREAHGLFTLALKNDPQNELARYYLALSKFQEGDAKGALAQWQSLLADMASDAPGRQDVMQRIYRTARSLDAPKGPSTSEVVPESWTGR